MLSHLRPALGALVFFTLVTGVLYPFVITLTAQLLFPTQANGSLIVQDGNVVGSVLIGQAFDAPEYFWSRPSATAPFAYNAAASSGSNLGPTNPALRAAIKTRVENLRAADPDNTVPIPIDLVTASASGLDPHISVAAAEYQVARVARARSLNETRVRALVTQFTEPRAFGILGEPRVNVLMLNRALDIVQ